VWCLRDKSQGGALVFDVHYIEVACIDDCKVVGTSLNVPRLRMQHQCKMKTTKEVG
jgi:hypothetical protein